MLEKAWDKNKSQDVTVIEEAFSRLRCPAKQIKISPMSEFIFSRKRLYRNSTNKTTSTVQQYFSLNDSLVIHLGMPELAV